MSVSRRYASIESSRTRNPRARFVQPKSREGSSLRNMMGKTTPPTAVPVAATPRAKARLVVN